jgi:hypothetical protein
LELQRNKKSNNHQKDTICVLGKATRSTHVGDQYHQEEVTLSPKQCKQQQSCYSFKQNGISVEDDRGMNSNDSAYRPNLKAK